MLLLLVVDKLNRQLSSNFPEAKSPRRRPNPSPINLRAGRRSLGRLDYLSIIRGRKSRREAATKLLGAETK